jgi:sec-independent protein translocase protein TatA
VARSASTHGAHLRPNGLSSAGPDLIVILLIILVLFGAKKLPELARGMGSAIKEFQKAKDEFSDELHSAGKTDATKGQPDVRTPEATVPRIENAPTASTGGEIRRMAIEDLAKALTEGSP